MFVWMAWCLYNLRNGISVGHKQRRLKGFLHHPLDARKVDLGRLRLSAARTTHNNISMGRKPLVLLLPWLGATSDGISKYEALYKKYDFDVIVHRATLKDFLWPKAGLRSSLKLLNRLNDEAKSNATNRPLIVHSFSIGCYFYALLLMQMEMQQEKFQDIRSSIVGQVLDSPVLGSLEEMAQGVSQMLSRSSLLVSRMYRNLCLWYFYVSKQYTVSYYKQGMHTIFFKAPVVSSLLLLSEDDPLYIPKAAQEMEESWRARGTSVLCKIWKESGHAQHLRFHPGEYTYLMDNFLQGCLYSECSKHLKSKL